MAHPTETKKEKEKKRRKDILFHLNVRERYDSDQKSSEVRSKEGKPSNEKSEKPDFKDRLAGIRNRIDNSRRISEDGWTNRMTATSDEGARGRSL
ncbi:MAG: hypothetical protein WCJ33_10020 [Pseudomonadota bacterium]